MAGDLMVKAKDMETNKPQLKQYDSWGNRVDEIVTCQSWKVCCELVCFVVLLCCLVFCVCCFVVWLLSLSVCGL